MYNSCILQEIRNNCIVSILQKSKQYFPILHSKLESDKNDPIFHLIKTDLKHFSVFVTSDRIFQVLLKKSKTLKYCGQVIVNALSSACWPSITLTWQSSHPPFFCMYWLFKRRWTLKLLLCNLFCLLAVSQIESMMLKLQRLQQKAILDDDYDAGKPV